MVQLYSQVRCYDGYFYPCFMVHVSLIENKTPDCSSGGKCFWDVFMAIN